MERYAGACPSASRKRARWLAAVPLLFVGAVPNAAASCDVSGGGPIVTDSTVVCTGATTTPVVATGVSGVRVTVVPGATLATVGRAINLGPSAFIDVQAGAQVSCTSCVTVIGVGIDSIVSIAGTLSGGGALQLALPAGSIGAIYGTMTGRFDGASGATYFVYPGATTNEAVSIRYLSSAGTVRAVNLFAPLSGNSEVYNEVGGNVPEGIEYLGRSSGFIGVSARENSIIVNRGRVGPDQFGNAIGTPPNDRSNVQITNVAGAVLDGNVVLARSYGGGVARGENAGSVNGIVVLSALSEESDESSDDPFGDDQLFVNTGFVRGISVRSGRFEQRAQGSFPVDAPLEIMSSAAREFEGSVEQSFAGRLVVSGTHGGACIGDPFIGGIVELQPGAVLTLAPVATQACDFGGPVVGEGRLVKSGAGTQVLTTDVAPRDWGLVRPPASFSGGTSITAGTLAVGAPGVLGTGPLAFAGANATLRLDAAVAIANAVKFDAAAIVSTNGFDATLAGPRAGAATLRKTGAGTLELTGTATHTGGTTVDEGVLRVAGATPGSASATGSGTLAGAAQFGGSISASGGGVVRPSAGAAAGVTMSTSGALALSAPAALRIAIDGNTHDRIDAASATLSNSALVLDVVSPPSIGEASTLVSIGGSAPAVGTFAGLAESGVIYVDALAYRISYVGGDGNDIVATRVTAALPPTGVTLTPGDTTVSLAFAAPADNGSGSILGYRATCTPGNVAAESPSSPLLVAGLTNGVAYDCNVRTLSGAAPSAPSATVSGVPRGKSTPPTAVVATAGVSSFSVAFAPPANDGGFAVTQYRLACEPGSVVATGPGSPLGLTGLTNGVAYACTVAAQTSFGLGHPASFVVTPRTVPDVPTGLAATPYNQSARFDFSPPAFDGGAPITQFTVRCQPGGMRTVNGPASPLTLTGLTNGTTYSCWVRATNVAGNSAVSAEVTVTPLAVPSAVRNLVVTDGAGGSVASFDPPTLGAPITDYVASCAPGGQLFTHASPPLALAPLENYVDYDCEVHARNPLGSGPPTTFSTRPVADCAAQGGDFDEDSVCDASDGDDDGDGLGDGSDPCPLEAANNCPASAPTATGQSLATTRDTALPLVLVANDPDGDALIFTISTLPSHGTLSGSAAARTYQPATGFIGIDTFAFTVDDGDYVSAPASVSILVRSTDDDVFTDDFE